MSANLQKTALYYQRTVMIWEEFCKLHKDLFDITCDEYLALLSSEIDTLENLLNQKELIIKKVSEVENERSSLISKLNQEKIFSVEISKSADLIDAFSALEASANIPALRNLNSLLIDIIEKLQDQNKKNQIFLNKAMISLNDIRQNFNGKKQYPTYGADGAIRSAGR
jgi:flagellar biosynthesis/type III secretory pathway chaperone